jgi:hypothetical protein
LPYTGEKFVFNHVIYPTEHFAELVSKWVVFCVAKVRNAKQGDPNKLRIQNEAKAAFSELAKKHREAIEHMKAQEDL